MTQQEEALFQQRLARHRDELRWLYMELYDNGPMFGFLGKDLRPDQSDMARSELFQTE